MLAAQVIYEKYVGMHPTWPTKGRHILAQFDFDSIYVYQAYRPSIARYAVDHQRFGGDFSYSRMSWVKPNFLWMMYRCGWAMKERQERVLAIRLPCLFFDELLRQVVPSTYDPRRYSTHELWQRAIAESDVRLQWDPDHDPLGRPLQRRAMQIGIRGESLRRYGETELLSITDITDFVIGQRTNLHTDFSELLMPQERVYLPDPVSAASVGVDIA